MMKNIYNILLRTAAIIVVAFGTVSCLEKLPGNAIPESEGMKTFDDAEQTLTGIYAALMDGALYSGYLTLLPDIQADLVHAVQGNTNTYGTLWQWDIRPTNAETEAVYGSLYRVIGRCNFYLDQVEDLRASLTDDESITYLDYYTGEVYCARALAYSELIRSFCQAYTPETADLKESGVAIDSTYFGQKPLKRSTLRESYKFVLNDLEKAETLLEDAGYAYSSPYLTYAAAAAIHARTALYMQDWDTAIEYSTKLIDDGAYALSTAASYTSGVSPITGESKVYNYIDYMWTNDLSTEVIWQIEYTVTSYGGALGQNFLNFNNDYYYYYPDYVPSQWVLDLYASGDARYSAYFTTLQTGYAHGLTFPLLTKYFGNESFIANIIYHVSKPKPFRLAEQYLIRAEAYCEKEQYAKASADLTELNTARNAKAGSLSAANWRKVISDERVKELYMEGFRLHDLKRWNMGFERVHQTATQPEGSTKKIQAGDYRFVWPIPQNDIEAPGSEISQNPGYVTK